MGSIFGSKYSIHLDDFVISRNEEGKDLEYHRKSQILSFADMYSIHEEETIQSNNNANGIPQEVLMWSNFVRYCKAMDEESEKKGDESTTATMKEGKVLLE